MRYPSQNRYIIPLKIFVGSVSLSPASVIPWLQRITQKLRAVYLQLCEQGKCIICRRYSWQHLVTGTYRNRIHKAEIRNSLLNFL